MQSLADADGLTAYCRGLVDARLKEERKRMTARRDEELKRARKTIARRSPPARPSATRSCARSTKSTPSRWSRSRRRSSATCARPSTGTTAGWPSCATQVETSFPKLDEKYKSLKEQIQRATRRTGARWPTAGARGCGTPRPSSTRSTTRSTATARPGTTPPGPSARCRGSSRR